MFIRVKSPNEELAEVYAQEEKLAEPYKSVELFLSDRCAERLEIINELSHELAELRFHYEQVCYRLKQHVPDFVPPEEKPYDPNFSKVSML